jgi:hypothetical protein
VSGSRPARRLRRAAPVADGYFTPAVGSVGPKKRQITWATHAGLVAVSHSTVAARTTWNPDDTDSTFSTTAVSRTRDPDRHRRGEAGLVQPVVDRPDRVVDLEELDEEDRDEGQREVAVRDRSAERAGGGAFGVDVDPLVVAGRVGELADLLLGHLVPRTRPEYDGLQGGVGPRP